jgi:hypothetical protein
MVYFKRNLIMKPMRAGLGYIAAGAVGGALIGVGQGRSLQIKPMSISYPDLIAVLLTAVALIVAIFGVVMAVLAIFGYKHFKGVVEKASKTSAEEAVTKAAKEMVMDEVNSKEVKQLIMLEVGKMIDSEKNGTLSPWLKEQQRQEAALHEVDQDSGGSNE